VVLHGCYLFEGLLIKKKRDTVARMELSVNSVFLIGLWKCLQNFLLSVLYRLLRECKKMILEKGTFHVR
jgi:hypothetical protein